MRRIRHHITRRLVTLARAAGLHLAIAADLLIPSSRRGNEKTAPDRDMIRSGMNGVGTHSTQEATPAKDSTTNDSQH